MSDLVGFGFLNFFFKPKEGKKFPKEINYTLSFLKIFRLVLENQMKGNKKACDFI